MQPDTFRSIAWSLKHMRDELKKLDFMAVRFPQLALDDWVALIPRVYEHHQSDMRTHLHPLRDRFCVLQPPIANGQQPWEVADLDTGGEKGWRLGSMYTGGKVGLDAIETRNYAFFTEAENNDSATKRHEL